MFQLYANLIPAIPSRAETAMQHAVNLIRIAPGLEEMVLVSSDQLDKNRGLLLYTLMDPHAVQANADRVRIVKDHKGDSYVYQYLGEYDFSVRKIPSNQLGHRTFFMARFPDSSVRSGIDLSVHCANIGAGLQGFDFMRVIGVSVSLHNLAVARNVIGPDAPPTMLTIVQYADVLMNLVIGASAIRNVSPLFLGKTMVSTPTWLSNISFALGAVLAGRDALNDYKNEDFFASGSSSMASVCFVAAMVPKVFSIAVTTVCNPVGIAAAVFMAAAWCARSSETELLLRTSAYGKNRKPLPSQKDKIKAYDLTSVFEMYKKLFPVEKRTHYQTDDFSPEIYTYEWHLSNLARMCEPDKEKKPAVTDKDVIKVIDHCRNNFTGKVLELHWPLFQPPAAKEQVSLRAQDKAKGITLHMEGDFCVARFCIRDEKQKLFLKYREENEKFREFASFSG